MANGRILRGEVYWVCLDDSVGSEQMTGRPAVVISGNKANEILQTVIVAYITSQSRPTPSNVSIKYENEYRRVLCNQIRTIDKQRLTRYIFTLEDNEMQRVTGSLATSMCIPLATTKKEEPAEDPEKTALRAECDMWKRLYDVTMNQLVEIKVTSELSLRMARYDEEPELEPELEPEPELPEEPEEPVVSVEFEPDPELTDINSCSFDDLKRLGLSPNIILTIINGRPYKMVSDLRPLPGMTSIMYQLIERKICCNPVVVEEPVVAEEPVAEVEEPVVEVEEPVVAEERVNINTATGRELMEKLGINECYAYSITSYRNKNGLFVDLEELRECKGVPKIFLDRYRDRLTIGEEPSVVKVEAVVEAPVVPDEKVNVNTATVDELISGTGMGEYTAKRIVAYRKRNGPFRCLEDLLNVTRFGNGCMKQFGDMLTVGEVPEEEQEPAKVNINSASLRELMAVGFEKRAAALIVNERRRFGNFRNLDELRDLPEISGKILRKLWDRLEV